MSISAILGQKIDQQQRFLENGTRIPVTQVLVSGNVVVRTKTKEKDNYSAIQLGFGSQKRSTREVRLLDSDSASLTAGTIIKASEVFKPGDIVDVIGVSKGKGYAGVVKRHHFKGGPRTHGQSDRERAPGAIGSTTTPGRVYKGKRMAGRMGQEKVTVKNLKVVDVNDEKILIKGLVPGSKNSLIMIRKAGEDKKFVPLYQEVSKEEKVSKVSKGEEKGVEVKKDAS